MKWIVLRQFSSKASFPPKNMNCGDVAKIYRQLSGKAIRVRLEKLRYQLSFPNYSSTGMSGLLREGRTVKESRRRRTARFKGSAVALPSFQSGTKINSIILSSDWSPLLFLKTRLSCLARAIEQCRARQFS